MTMAGEQDSPYGTTADSPKLSAAQRSKIRRLSAPKELAPDEEAGELNIVPFLDIITNVLMFVLASITVTFTITLETEAPKSSKGGGGAPPPTEEEKLNLTVIITGDGYVVKGRAASIAPGCETTGSGVTVPRVDAPPGESADGKKYNAGELQKCVRKLKDKVPNADAETQVMVSANPQVPVQEIIRVMDALRKDDKGECKKEGPDYIGPGCLFPKVVFTLLK